MPRLSVGGGNARVICPPVVRRLSVRVSRSKPTHALTVARKSSADAEGETLNVVLKIHTFSGSRTFTEEMKEVHPE
jgi:hypothetical protein